MADSNLKIVSGYVTGMIGDMIRLNALYYGQNWDMGLDFEARVAQSIAAFFLRYDAQRDGIWSVMQGDQVLASIIADGIHGDSKGAHIRYFIVGDSLRGQGFGRKLMQSALDFCVEKQFKRVYLKTFEGLEAACHLYESFGFVCYEEAWDGKLKDLFYERYLTQE